MELFINMDNEKICKEISLGLTAMNEANMKRRLILPLKTLPWLREQMAEMLIRHDGTEKIEKEAPAKIPQQILINNRRMFFFIIWFDCLNVVGII